MRNMNDQYQEIQQLIDRFFDGDTSLGEEQRIYDFFRRHPQDLPEELEAYREMFLGFGAISLDDVMSVIDEDGAKSVVGENGVKSVKGKPAKFRRIFLYAVSGMAATLLLCLGIFAAVHIHEDRMLARTYGGSYVIVNGERIDDLERIKPDIEHALGKAEAIENNLEENSVVKEAEQNLLDNVGDPEEKARIQQLLNE